MGPQLITIGISSGPTLKDSHHLKRLAPTARRISSDTMPIEKLHARQVFDSRGNPTVEVWAD